MKKYTLIYADPPWLYRDKAADGNRGAGFKYPVMNVLDICRLPVWELAAENCLLAMWWVPTQPLEALKVVEAWGVPIHDVVNYQSAVQGVRRGYHRSSLRMWRKNQHRTEQQKRISQGRQAPILP